ISGPDQLEENDARRFIHDASGSRTWCDRERPRRLLQYKRARCRGNSQELSRNPGRSPDETRSPHQSKSVAAAHSLTEYAVPSFRWRTTELKPLRESLMYRT